MFTLFSLPNYASRALCRLPYCCKYQIKYNKSAKSKYSCLFLFHTLYIFLSCLSTSVLQTMCKFLFQIYVRTSVITRENDFLHSYCHTFIVQLCQKQLSERGSVKIISELFMLFLCLYIVRRGSRRLLVVHNPFQNFYFIARGINHHFRKNIQLEAPFV